VKIDDVEVICSDQDYKLIVAVYRSTISPKRLTVHIEKVVPVPPRQPKEPMPEPDVCQVVSGGDSRLFKGLLYPKGT